MKPTALSLGVKRPDREAENSLIWCPVEEWVQLYSICTSLYTLMAFTGRIYPTSLFDGTVQNTELSRPCIVIHQTEYRCWIWKHVRMSAVTVFFNNFPSPCVHWDYHINSSIYFFMFFLSSFLPSFLPLYLRSFLCIFLPLFQAVFTHHFLVR